MDKSSEHFDSQLAQLSRFIGKRINRIGLLVWPDSDGLLATDSQLHIEVAEGADVRAFTCSTDADGQTPQIEFEQWETEFHFRSYRTESESGKRQSFGTLRLVNLMSCLKRGEKRFGESKRDR